MKIFWFQDKQISQTTQTPALPLNFTTTEIFSYKAHMGLAK